MSFEISKLVGFLLDPVNFFALFLFVQSLLAVLDNEGGAWAARRIIVLLALFLILLMVLPVGSLLLMPLENKEAVKEWPSKVDGIFLVAGGESSLLTESRGLPIAPGTVPRYLALAQAAKRYPSAEIAIIGRTDMAAPAEHTTTQDVSKAFLKQLGVPLKRVSFETESRTTHENAVFAKKKYKTHVIYGSRKAKKIRKKRWLLITSAFHMPRAKASFMREGFSILPYAQLSPSGGRGRET